MIKIIKLFTVMFFVMYPFQSVIADGETPTPSPTGTPTMVCPVATYDPSKLLNYEWAQNCSVCIPTPTSSLPTSVIPTGEIVGTVTPTTVPTITPTITPTATSAVGFAGLMILNTAGSPIPTYTNVDMVDFQSYNTYKTYNHYSDLNTYNLRMSVRSSGASGTSYKVGFFMESDSYYPSNAYDVKQKLHFNNISNGYITLTFASDSYKNPGVVKSLAPSEQYDVYFVNQSGYGGASLVGTPPIKFNAVILNSKGVGVTDLTIQIDGLADVGNDGARRWDNTWKIIRGGYELSEPTPTPSPTITPTPGACGNWDYFDYAGDPVASFSGIITTNGTCFGVIPNFQIGIPDNPYTDLEQIGIPGVEICPVWVDFGEIKFLGLQIPIDIFVFPLVMMLVWVIAGI